MAAGCNSCTPHLQRGKHGVAHVQLARHIWGRHGDDVRLPRGILIRLEVAIALPPAAGEQRQRKGIHKHVGSGHASSCSSGSACGQLHSEAATEARMHVAHTCMGRRLCAAAAAVAPRGLTTGTGPPRWQQDQSSWAAPCAVRLWGLPLPSPLPPPRWPPPLPPGAAAAAAAAARAGPLAGRTVHSPADCRWPGGAGWPTPAAGAGLRLLGGPGT